MLAKINEILYYRLFKYVYSVINFFILKLNGITYGTNLSIRGVLKLYGHGGKITIGNNVTINTSTWSNPIGSTSCTKVRNMGGNLTIGNNVGISNTVIGVEKSIVIKDNVMIGAGVQIYDTDFHALHYSDRIAGAKGVSKDIIIENGAFIGAGSIILKGTVIGENSIVGAGSVVSGKTIGKNEIWGGNPAKFIRKIEQ